MIQGSQTSDREVTPKVRQLRIVEAAPATSGTGAPRTAQEVLDLIQQGNPNGAAALYDQVGAQVDATVWRLLGADSEHDDIVHDILCTLLEKASQVRDAQRFHGWVRRVAVSRVINELRRRRVRRFWSPLEESPDQFEGTTHGQHQSAHISAVYLVLDRMPAKERIAVSLRYFEQYTVEEIAETLKCSRRSVNRRLADGTNRFRRLAVRLPELSEWISEAETARPGEVQ